MASLVRDPEYRAFASHLAELRRKVGLQQHELAAKLDKPQSYISKLERFERRMDPAEFCRIVRALGFDPAAEFNRAIEGTMS